MIRELKERKILPEYINERQKESDHYDNRIHVSGDWHPAGSPEVWNRK